jgi:hypothetical protein
VLPLTVQPVEIAEGAALSAAVNLGETTLLGIVLPANWTAAGLSFQASPDGGTTWCELFDYATGAAIAVPAVTPPSDSLGVFVAVDPAKLRGVGTLIIRSGTEASPVNQTNAVTLTIISRNVF